MLPATKNQFPWRLLVLVIFFVIVSISIPTPTTKALFASSNSSQEELLYLCPPVVAGRLFEEFWAVGDPLPNSTWSTYKRSWPSGQWVPSTNDWYVYETGSVRQSSNTANQINLAFESTVDVADGVIESCLQLLQVPPANSVIPHGIVFRFQDLNNFYGVGFQDHDTLVLGRMRNGVPEALAAINGYISTNIHRFKIVLERSHVEVYIAGAGQPYPSTPQFDIYNGDLLTGLRSGKIGLGTYGVGANFGTIAVNFDCSESETQLPPVAQAVLAEIGTPTYFCRNQVNNFIVLPGSTSPVHQEAFVEYAEAIENAKSDVSFTTMLWDRAFDEFNVYNETSAGSLALVGDDPDPVTNPNGLLKLYQDVTNNPNDYPYGMNIRILLGVKYNRGESSDIDYREHVLEILKEQNIPLHESLPNGEWIIQVARYQYGAFPNFIHSHVKLLVIDGVEAIVGGYNVNNWYAGGVHDMGVHVSGPVAFESLEIFDSLWEDARGLCDPYEFVSWVSITNIRNDCDEYDVSIASLHHEPPAWATYSFPSDDAYVFPLTSGANLSYEGDEATTAAIENASASIDIIQQRVTRSTVGSLLGQPGDGFEPLPPIQALINVIQANTDPNFKVRVLAGYSYSNVIGVQDLIHRLEDIDPDLVSYLETRFFAPMHTKTLAIDGEFLIVGSQNWDWSWDSGINELGFGITNSPGILNEFDTAFDAYWAVAKTPCSVNPTVDWGTDLLDCMVTSSEAIVMLDVGDYVDEDIVIDQPVTIVGVPGTVLSPVTSYDEEKGTSTPVLRITSSDVTITGVKIRNSSGYAIEIGDGVTPLENIFISRSVFENNALGGIKINGPASIVYIENNTFVGGEAGLMINVSGSAAENTIVRNNIFAAHSVAPVIINSANDGGISYTYNLFYNCPSLDDPGLCPLNWLDGTFHPQSIEHHNLVNVHPVFADPVTGNYRLAYPSPAIDAGDPTLGDGPILDGDGDDFVRIDMGAFEFYTDSVPPPPILKSPYPGEMVTGTVQLIMGGPEGIEVAYRIAQDGQFNNTVAVGRAVYQETIQLTPGTYYWQAEMAECCWDNTSPVRQFTVLPYWMEQSKLKGLDTIAGDDFGVAVAMDDNTSVIGAFGHGGIGAAYVFTDGELGWEQQAKLTPSDGSLGDGFGQSVAISNDTIVIGAPGDNDNGNLSGSVYVFERVDAETWVQVAKLTASDGAAEDMFGYSVAISNESIVVGAPGDDDSSSLFAGSVYIFTLAGGGWSQHSKLVRPYDGNISHGFGESLAIDENTVLVGVPEDHVTGMNPISAGSVYVFVYDDIAWQYQARLMSRDLAGGDLFGTSVALLGDTAVFGAIGDDDNGGSSGSAYIFERIDTETWVEVIKLTAPDGASADYFGNSVSISGNVVVVGAFWNDDRGSGSGSAYVFEYETNDWILKTKLVATDGEAIDLFGVSVAVSGSQAIIGAYGDDDNGLQAGAAYIVAKIH